MYENYQNTKGKPDKIKKLAPKANTVEIAKMKIYLLHFYFYHTNLV